ncbi:hypothetical protein [Isoptericola dokdonensis]|uniref:Uncharacterized protein n=1 Tax=Isoptericola dokdonensis DS-3 TaxID=1300344 RepID=A0A168F3H8_9MICO|nr:hypothetical protein [Isoptericola dokdonensis]ANC30849.1 hypothetical protein I598_1289 [Isoptericola dokdonensis DS-3]
MTIVLAAGAAAGGINWDAAQAVVGLLAILTPFVFWFVERRDRRAAEAESRRLREGAQISHVRFRQDLRNAPEGVQRWRVSNDSDGPLQHVQLEGRSSLSGAITGRVVGDLAPGDEATVDLEIETAGLLRDAFLLVNDAEWRIWKVPYLSRPELIEPKVSRTGRWRWLRRADTPSRT